MLIQAIIPDTMEGALILSLIDFVASFVIISGIGVVLALFPMLNRVWLGRPGLRKRSALAPATPVPPAPEEPPLAVIAAAVYAVLGGSHRIVHIEPTRGAESWVSEGRQAHHASHLRRH